jgi:hypothetical protein
MSPEVIGMDVEILLPKVDADLEAAETQLRAAQGRVDELRRLKESLLYAIRTYGMGQAATQVQPRARVESTDAGTTGTASQWSTLRNMDAAEMALREMGRPADTNEIRRFLEGVGRVLDHQQVKSSLNYLKNRKRVVSVKPGLWDVPREDSEGTASTAPSDDIPASGAGGDTGAAPQADRDLDQNYRFGNRDNDHGASVVEAVG